MVRPQTSGLCWEQGLALDADHGSSDAALLQAYARGDRRAAAMLTARVLPRVYRHGLRLLGDSAEAEDVAQEAMMRLWRIAPDWRDGEAKVETWLYRVTANLCVDRLRKRRTVGLDEVDEPLSDAPDAVAQIQSRTRHDALQAGLDQLPVRQRQAIVLRHIDGLSNPQIAEVMGVGSRAVESLIARGKRTLAALLAARKPELGFEDDTQ